MSVGTKKVTTQLLDLSIKKNFESVKDGTGKPLSELEGMLEPFGELGKTISNLVNKVKSVVNKILSAIGNVIKSVAKFIGKILSAIGGAIKAALKYVMGLLGIPLDAITGIFKKVMKYIKSALGVLGGWIKDIFGLGSNASHMRDITGVAVSDITKTGLVAGLLGFFRHDSRGLKNAHNRLTKEFGIESVTKAYNQLFRHGSYGNDYYDHYYNLDSSYSNEDDRRIHRGYYKSNKKRNDYFNKVKLDSPDDALRRFSSVGISGTTAKDLVALSNINDLDRVLPRNSRRVTSDVTYADIKDRQRSGYTDIEKLNIIRKSSGTLKHNEETYDNYTGDGIVNDYASRRRIEEAYAKRFGIDHGSIFERFTYKGRRPKIDKPLEFLNKEYTPSVIADQTKETELEKIATTLGVENITLSKPLTYADYEGFSKTKRVETQVDKTIKPGKGKELIFKY